MKRTPIRLLIISCLLAVGSLNTVAQEKKTRPDDSKVEVKVPTDGTFKVLFGPQFAFGKVVKGAPYSATATTETIQTLNDGNQIIRKNESKLYRDSEGRTRIEQTLGTIGKWTADGEAPQSILINDPVAGLSYSLDPRARTAYKIINPQKKTPAAGAQSETLMVNGQKVTTYTINGKAVTQAEFEAFASAKKKREALEEATAGRRKEAPNDPELDINGKKVTKAEFEAAVEKKRRAQEELLVRRRKEEATGPDIKGELEILRSGKQDDVDKGQKKSESLGTQTIEGVTAEGTRLTLTIPAGEIGNTLPLELVEESWYSPELQITVMTRYRDPRTGETTYRLTNLSRSDPDRSLFEVSADYTVIDTKLPPPKPKPTKEE